jgi:hypothetical protein
VPKARRAMRERVTIQSAQRKNDAYNQPIFDGWYDIPELTGLPANWEHTGGTETFRGRQVEAGIAGVFELRLPPVEITPAMRVKHLNFADKTYEIVSVRPSDNGYEGGFRYVLVFVRALADV